MREPEIADLLIVGGGPAGAAAAVTAARAGLTTVVVDKARFPRDKICGDGLTTGALRLLEDLGVDPGEVASWTPVHDIKVSGPTGWTATFPLPRPPPAAPTSTPPSSTGPGPWAPRSARAARSTGRSSTPTTWS